MEEILDLISDLKHFILQCLYQLKYVKAGQQPLFLALDKNKMEGMPNCQYLIDVARESK